MLAEWYKSHEVENRAVAVLGAIESESINNIALANELREKWGREDYRKLMAIIIFIVTSILDYYFMQYHRQSAVIDGEPVQSSDTYDGPSLT